MANNFLKQLLNVVETGKLLGVTNIRDLYNTGFANSGISYKDFKKQMHDYKIYGNLGKNDMARLSGMYYGSKKADWEAKKPLDLARIEKRIFAPAFNLNTPNEISPLNIPVSRPVIQKTAVISAPKNNSNKQLSRFKKWWDNLNIDDAVDNSLYGQWTDRWNKEGRRGIKENIETIMGLGDYIRDLMTILKKQLGGQVKSSNKELDAVMLFVKALAQTLQADPQLVIQAALLNPEALKSAVQVYQESKGDIQKAAQAFSLVLQSKTQAAKHGAKLNYLKSLKNQCADDEELYYFKKGGSIGCGCKKKEQGGELKEKKESTVSKFKKACGGFKVKFMAGGLSPKKKNLDQASKDSIKINDNQNMELMSERPGKLIPNPKYDKGKTDDRALLWVPDRTKAPYKKEEKVKKDCGGSKIKLKKGDKVCPKCGKVHAAGIGCSVAKFKYRKLGGQL